uniref:hypothetical protein n=1 Tax=Ningiella ruwaisensis TaxID=2364274 RepID=UPI0010A06CA1|nr:hypothetical protein [Ningiella ruwaisensis]
MKSLSVFLVFVFLLAGCSSTPEPEERIPREAESQELPEHRKVYFLQHRVLPEWTFDTNGQFFADLYQGDLTKLKGVATEVVSPSYASAISSEVIAEKDAVLIVFPEPKMMANCFYVLIRKNGDSFSFYTYEKTMSFGDEDHVVGVIGSWSSDGTHANMGPRTYRASSDFIADVLYKDG